MTRGKTIWLALFIGQFLCFAGEPATAKEIRYEWNNISRIVAVGDVHGAHDNLVHILVNAELVDEKLNWTGGKAHLVQMGDLMDRGSDSRKSMDLLMKLEKEAERDGGKVHVLIGNHEAMNIVGFLDHVSPEEFASHIDSQSGKRRERVFQGLYRKQKEEAKARGEEKPSEDDARRRFESQYPLGFVEHRLAFRPQGSYGSWILKHNATIRINGVLFSHADWSEEMADLGIGEINRRIREELSGKAPLEDGIAFHPRGPLNYRKFARVALEPQPQKAHQAEVDRILTTLQATRLIVGHTITKGVIEPRFGGRHISIDTGMLELYGGGHQVALEIEGTRLRAIHPNGKVEVPEHLDESSRFEYLSAVAAVDPHNVYVQVEVAGLFQVREDLEQSQQVLEKLFQTIQIIPDQYRTKVCDLYREQTISGFSSIPGAVEMCQQSP